MKIKSNHLLIFLLSIIFMFCLIFLFGCKESIGTVDYFLEKTGELEDSEIVISPSEKTREEIDKIITEAEKEIEVEKQEKSEAELLEGFEEQEKLLPDEPITYNGDLEGVAVILIVDFKTTTVSGSLSLSGDDYVEAAINGNIEIESFKIDATFSGIMGSKKYDMTYPFTGIINGTISEDISIFKGVLLDDEGQGGDFTASK